MCAFLHCTVCCLSWVSLKPEQLRQQLHAVEAAAAAGAAEASEQQQAQLDGLSAGHASRIEQLQRELAADAGRRADLEAKLKVRWKAAAYQPTLTMPIKLV